MAQLLKGKDNGASALSAWLKLLLLKWITGDGGMGQATSTQRGMAVCPLLGSGPLQSGQSWLASSCPIF